MCLDVIETFLVVKVQTNARVNEIVSLDGDTLKVRVTTAPERGRANVAIINLVAEGLRLPKGALVFVRGVKSKSKLLRVRGMDAVAVRIALGGRT